MEQPRRQTILLLSKVLREYDWLLNAYNVDYFLEEHWNKVPKTWQDCLEKMNVNDILFILRPSNTTKFVFPLSLICLRALSFMIRSGRMMIKENDIPFKSMNVDSDLTFSFSNEIQLPVKPLKHSDHILCRGIKLKKRHEIEQLCKIIPSLMNLSRSCNDIIDCGSGQGHLSRILTLCYGHKVFSVEANCDNVKGASNHDSKVLNALRKLNLTQLLPDDMPTKVNCFLTPEHKIDNLVRAGESISPTSLDQHLLLGLHSCGSLSNLIMEEFVANPNTFCLVLACCCYMKVELDRLPMSQFLKENKQFDLSIEARELACHAIEKFMNKFDKNELDYLKVHGYRACLELLICMFDPAKKHSAMRSVKISSSMTFKEYCSKAIRELNVDIPEEMFDCDLVHKCLKQIDRVAIFYSLRLLIAPLSELYILLDYQQYLSEHNQVKRTYLIPLFDPKLSPRNFILVAHK